MLVLLLLELHHRPPWGSIPLCAVDHQLPLGHGRALAFSYGRALNFHVPCTTGFNTMANIRRLQLCFSMVPPATVTRRVQRRCQVDDRYCVQL